MMNAKLLQLLKKLHIYIFIVAVGAVGVYSCTDEEDPIVKPTAPVLSNYFAIQNSTVAQGTIPSNPSGVSLGEVVINSTAIAGGSSHVTITSDNDIQKLYVSIKGSNQYYTITPNQTKSNAFEFIILLSQYLNQNFEIQISALLGDGTITSLYSEPIIYHTAGTGGTGGLQVSLSFNNEKDVDLYVIQPDGTIIFYGNKGGHIYDSISQQYVYYWGLDLDSNPGCNIDSINNENVFYPDSLVQTGTYQVWINMYQNCDTSIATTCVVTANYASQLITPTFGVNPSTHIFPIGEPTNQIGSDTTGAVKIMEFNITNGSSTGSKKIYKPYLTESARMKLDMAHRRR